MSLVELPPLAAAAHRISREERKTSVGFQPLYTLRSLEEIWNLPASIRVISVKRGIMVSKKLGRILLAAAAIGLASAQAFEVASIKPSEPGGHGVQIQIAPGGRLVAKNVNVKFLIQQAYGVRDFQITGGPGWIGSERYDIVAKPEGEGDVTPDQLKPMIQALLAETVNLTLHHETKHLPAYALVLANN